AQRNTHLLVRRTLDDLYWVMSYSRWKDDRFWPLFRDTFVRAHPNVTVETLETAREFNFKRYHFQGIGRYEPADAYARGIADLNVLSNLLPGSGYMFGAKPGSIDAALYGFIANIYFYDIDTPLKECVVSKENLVAHCKSIHAAL
ncbi:MAG TPA: glutathione S-transferase C-terminal domain-containing protein, partial [Bradyrhizobium sp.]